MRPNVSLTDRVASYFRQHPNVWIDGRDFERIGGSYGWRTRISECRRSGMDIENRQRRVKAQDGSTFTISEYCFRPAFELTA